MWDDVLGEEEHMGHPECDGASTTGRKGGNIMNRVCSILVVAATISLATIPQADAGNVEGAGSYLLGPALPTVFTFDRDSMSCAVSWGTLGAPGPGPFSDPKMKLENVNFGMVVFSVKVTAFDVVDNKVSMTGRARSITTVNDDIVENAVYQYKVEATDGRAAGHDSFSMLLLGKDLMFDGHTFAPAKGAGLVRGDVVIRP